MKTISTSINLSTEHGLQKYLSYDGYLVGHDEQNIRTPGPYIEPRTLDVAFISPQKNVSSMATLKSMSKVVARIARIAIVSTFYIEFGFSQKNSKLFSTHVLFIPMNQRYMKTDDMGFFF